jgi:hypothetical protein
MTGRASRYFLVPSSPTPDAPDSPPRLRRQNHNEHVLRRWAETHTKQQRGHPTRTILGDSRRYMRTRRPPSSQRAGRCTRNGSKLDASLKGACLIRTAHAAFEFAPAPDSREPACVWTRSSIHSRTACLPTSRPIPRVTGHLGVFQNFRLHQSRLSSHPLHAHRPPRERRCEPTPLRLDIPGIPAHRRVPQGGRRCRTGTSRTSRPPAEGGNPKAHTRWFCNTSAPMNVGTAHNLSHSCTYGQHQMPNPLSASRPQSSEGQPRCL